MERLNYQIRVYGKSGEYITSIKGRALNISDERCLDFIRCWVGNSSEETLPITWCNVMIRKNGKLISYKDL